MKKSSTNCGEEPKFFHGEDEKNDFFHTTVSYIDKLAQKN